jgi:phage tail-like protein
MDANLTRHQLFLGKPNWACCVDAAGKELSKSWASGVENTSGLDYDSTREQLRLQPRLVQFRRKAGRQKFTPADLRGADSDSFGNWYWITASNTEIMVYSSGSSSTSHFWSACDGARCVRDPQLGDFQSLAAPVTVTQQYAGLAVTEDHYLVVGLLAPAGLLVFDLCVGGPPQTYRWPRSVPFIPFDMCSRPAGGVFILDRENACYWELDRCLRVVPGDGLVTTRRGRVETFQPTDHSVVRSRPDILFPSGISVVQASPLDSSDYVAIEALPDRTVLLLETNPNLYFSRITRYQGNTRLGQPVSLQSMQDLIAPRDQPNFTLLAHDFTYVQQPDCGPVDALYVVPQEGDQVYVFQLQQENGQISLVAQTTFIPLRLFEGKGLVTSGTRVYYDFSDRWLPIFAQPQPRFVFDATFETPVLDGHEPGCVWHRFTMDACLPSATTVEVWSSAADEKSQIGLLGWNAERIPYRRGNGSEQPYSYRLCAGGLSTYEFLFQQLRGRYAKLRVRLSGDGTTSPRIHAIRAYYPRFSYLNHYLPGVYRQEPQSASFLDRLLANFEGMFTALEDRIALARILLDVRSAPPEFVNWLASWFGCALDPNWEDYRRRLLLAHMMDLFQYRGTSAGLKMALHLALDQCVDDSIFNAAAEAADDRTFRTIEKFRLRKMPPVVLGDATATAPIKPDPRKPWIPSQGGAELQRRYAAVSGVSPSDPFPVIAPTGPTAGAWQNFCTSQLGFIPADTSVLSLWQALLTRRYHRIALFNAAYNVSMTFFQDITWPTALPPDGIKLQDWYDFHMIVLGTWTYAHQFTVLIPVQPGTDPNSADQQRRRQLAQRVIDLEKPAHTTSELKYYWNLFRIGTARLGDDTVLDRGSRDPRLMPPFVLGQSFAGEGYLAAGFPRNVRGRQILDQRTYTSQEEDS